MWSNFFRDGGWGMYPTSLFGLVLVAAAVSYALRPEPRYGRVVWTATAMTSLSGVLGTAVGLITAARYTASLAREEQLTVLLVGLAEALNNLVLAMVLCVLAAVVALVGALRGARAEARS